jgi:hypothetical protein
LPAVSRSVLTEKRRFRVAVSRLLRFVLAVVLTIGFMGFHAHAEIEVGGFGASHQIFCESGDGDRCPGQAKSGANETCGPTVCAAIPAPEPKTASVLSLSGVLALALPDAIARNVVTDRATPPPRGV